MFGPEIEPSGRLVHYGLFYPYAVVPLIVRGVIGVWFNFAKYIGGIFYII